MYRLTGSSQESRYFVSAHTLSIFFPAASLPFYLSQDIAALIISAILTRILSVRSNTFDLETGY